MITPREKKKISSELTAKQKINMFCNECGEKIKEASKFCNNCGTKVIASIDLEEKLEQSQKGINQQRDKDKPKNKLNPRKIIFLLILSAIAVFYAAVGAANSGYGGGDVAIERSFLPLLLLFGLIFVLPCYFATKMILHKRSLVRWIVSGVTFLLILGLSTGAIIYYMDYRDNVFWANIARTSTNKQDFSEQTGNLYRNTKYNFRINFPEGWEIKTGDGPNILQKAVKDNNSISVGVREIPAEYIDKTATIKNVMSLNEFKDSAIEEVKAKFPGAKLLDYGETKLDNTPTYWVKYSSPYSTLDTDIEGTLLQYQLLSKNVFYFITAGTLSSEFEAMESEFKKSISTFVIENY